MVNIVFKNESYNIVGACMEVHSNLGKGFNEVVYKDALELEFSERKIPFVREKAFTIFYKNKALNHNYYADFVLYDNIIFEVKCTKSIIDDHIKQTLNYMAITKSKLGIIANFGEKSFNYKRIVV